MLYHTRPWAGQTTPRQLLVQTAPACRVALPAPGFEVFPPELAGPPRRACPIALRCPLCAMTQAIPVLDNDTRGNTTADTSTSYTTAHKAHLGRQLVVAPHATTIEAGPPPALLPWSLLLLPWSLHCCPLHESASCACKLTSCAMQAAAFPRTVRSDLDVSPSRTEALVCDTGAHRPTLVAQAT